MRVFSEFLTESKNLHMEHLEDSVFNEGSAGVLDAIRFLESIKNMLTSSEKSGIRVTVKWDGRLLCLQEPIQRMINSLWEPNRYSIKSPQRLITQMQTLTQIIVATSQIN